MGKKGGSKDLLKQAKKEKQERKAAKKQAKSSNEGNILDLVSALDNTTPSPEPSALLSPIPRTSFTFLHSKNGFIIFGGEFYDSNVCKVFNDTYKWNPGKEENEWKKSLTKPLPKPRVGHASCLFNDDVYVLGGEFATSSQFYHFRDFWKLDTRTLTWTELSSLNGPSSRSGHRLSVCRNLILSFGGFQDNGKEMRYHNDLFTYTPSANAWKKLVVSKCPPARSAAVVAANNDGMLVSGGFSKTKDTARDCKGVFHDDMWWIDLRPLFDGSSPSLSWVRLKRKALTRAGLAYCQHKNLVYAFGGVIDNDAGGISYNSSFFFNDIWMIDLGTRQWTKVKTGETTALQESAEYTAFHSLSLGAPVIAHRPKKEYMERVVLDVDLLKKIESECESKKNNESSKDKRKSKLNEADQMKIRDAGILEKMDSNGYDTDPRELTAPLPRANGGISVKDGYLYLYGGLLEIGSSRSIVFDDAWRFNLKTHVWECVTPGHYWEQSLKPVQGSSSDEDDDDDDDDEEDSPSMKDDDSDADMNSSESEETMTDTSEDEESSDEDF